MSNEFLIPDRIRPSWNPSVDSGHFRNVQASAYKGILAQRKLGRRPLSGTVPDASRLYSFILYLKEGEETVVFTET